MDSSISEGVRRQKKDLTVYVITKSFTSQRIEALLKEFNDAQICIQMQKQTDTLGLKMNRRYFVVVDNWKGSVVLGPEFSSLLMFIVGYPKLGPNKKNHYCSTPKQVMQKYKYYCSLPQYSKTIFQASKFKSKARISASKLSITSKLSGGSMKLQENCKSMSIIEKSSIPHLHPSKDSSIVDDNSKVFFLMSKKNYQFNKWINKLCANNPIKYKILEDIKELPQSLQICRTDKNFILVEFPDLQKLLQLKINSLKILIYSQPKLRNNKNDETTRNRSKTNFVKVKNKNIISYCYSSQDIVKAIRDLGFYVLSLKDIDKSIVRYDNPRAKQSQKNKLGKKILWASENDIQESYIFGLQNRQRKHTKTQKQIEDFVPFLDSGNLGQNEMKNTISDVLVSKKDERQQEKSQLNKECSEPLQNKECSEPKGSFLTEQRDQNKESKMRRVKKIKRVRSEYIDMGKKNHSSIIEQKIDQLICKVNQLSLPKKTKKEKKKRKLKLPSSSVESSVSQSEERKFSTIEKKMLKEKSSEPAFYKMKQVCNLPFSPATTSSQPIKFTRKYSFNIIKVPKQTHKIITYIQNDDNNNQKCPTFSEQQKCPTFSEQQKCPTFSEQQKAQYGINNYFQDQQEKGYQPDDKKYLKLTKKFEKKNRKAGMIKNNKNEGKSVVKQNVDMHQRSRPFGIMWKQFNSTIIQCQSFLSTKLGIPTYLNLSFFSMYELGQKVDSVRTVKTEWIIFLDDVRVEDSLSRILENPSMKIWKIYIISKKYKKMNEFYQDISEILRPFQNDEVKNFIKPIFINEYMDQKLILQKDFQQSLTY